MKIAIVGTGYVGLVAGTSFAENGHQVICVDKNAELIKTLQNQTIPIYEPGLEELFMRNIEEERLAFTTDIAQAVEQSLLVFICVGTPQGDNGQPDLSDLFDAARAIARALTGYRIIVIKSTCPVGTADEIRRIVHENTSQPFDVVVNPEFLKEGAAIDDFMRPDRIVVGCAEVRVLEIMKELYFPFLRTGKPFLAMSERSAELSKYAVNTLLAVRISLINELANLAEVCGADITEVRQALMADSRIGPAYLFPGLGYGGSKDILALTELAKTHHIPTPVIEGATATNERQWAAFVERVLQYYDGDVRGKRLAIWGASFKPRTDDLRNAPSLRIIDRLLESGAEVAVFDPVAAAKVRNRYQDRVAVAPKMYDALDKADGLIIVTEWREFHNPDFERMSELMNHQVIFDGRNLYEPKIMKTHGFRYISIGRAPV